MITKTLFSLERIFFDPAPQAIMSDKNNNTTIMIIYDIGYREFVLYIKLYFLLPEWPGKKYKNDDDDK